MALIRQEVEHLADLARLDLTEEEKDRFRRQLSEVLEYAARLGELDTDSVFPAGPTPHSVFRPDESRSPSPREHIFAPSVEKNCFPVRPVFGTDATESLPIGLQVIGPAFGEELILQVANVFEQATDWHARGPGL